MENEMNVHGLQTSIMMGESFREEYPRELVDQVEKLTDMLNTFLAANEKLAREVRPDVQAERLLAMAAAFNRELVPHEQAAKRVEDAAMKDRFFLDRRFDGYAGENAAVEREREAETRNVLRGKTAEERLEIASLASDMDDRTVLRAIRHAPPSMPLLGSAEWTEVDERHAKKYNAVVVASVERLERIALALRGNIASSRRTVEKWTGQQPFALDADVVKVAAAAA